MRHKTATIIVLIVALGGMIFSGYLSYTNLWGSGCQEALIKCGGAKTVEIFGLPTCVYGFFMFLIEAVLMTVIGGFIGIIFGIGTAALLSVFAGWATKISPISIIMATTFSISIGIVFGLKPAVQAAALNPIEALRYE